MPNPLPPPVPVITPDICPVRKMEQADLADGNPGSWPGGSNPSRKKKVRPFTRLRRVSSAKVLPAWVTYRFLYRKDLRGQYGSGCDGTRIPELEFGFAAAFEAGDFTRAGMIPGKELPGSGFVFFCVEVSQQR